MDVNFKPELEERLNRAAAESRRGVDEYVQQLVENYLDHDAWFRRKVSASMERLDRGEFLTHDQVALQLEKMFQP